MPKTLAGAGPSTQSSRVRARAIVFTGALLTVLLGALYLRPPILLTFLEHKVFDSLLRAATPRPPGGAVVVVDIDENSLAHYGQWPWPRYRVAELLSHLNDLHPAAVGLDMVFAEADRTSLNELRRQLKADLGVDLYLAGAPAAALESDGALARALAQGPFVLGYQFAFEGRRPGGGDCLLHPLAAAIRGGGGALFDAPGAVCNIPELSRAVSASGFFNVIPDPDGILRRVPLVIRHGGQLYPSLALATLLKAHGPSELILETGPGGVEGLRIGPASSSDDSLGMAGLLRGPVSASDASLRVAGLLRGPVSASDASLGMTGLLRGSRFIPLDASGSLTVNYRGRRRAFPHLSAVDVLQGKVPMERVEGKSVIVGTSAAGLLEIRSTPLDAAQPGPEIHATVIDNILAGDSLSRPPWARPLELALVLLGGALATLACVRLRALWGLGMVSAGSAAVWLGSALLLWRRQELVSPLLPAAAPVLVFGALIALRAWLAEREVRERTLKLVLTQDAVIQSMAALAETRDQETGGHIQRTRHYVRELARELRRNPRFTKHLDEATIDLLFRLAPLHDIGKVGVRDRILLKESSLTPEEFEEMKQHTLFGSRTIRLAERFLGDDSFLRIADQFALTHQEKWDGTGYPQGLRGEEIPLAGRLMAVADVYDALISRRGYKPAFDHAEAVRIMERGRGTHFDPDILDAFLRIDHRFREIAERFAGAGVEPELPSF